MKRLRHWGVHLGRLAMLAGILFVMHLQHARRMTMQRSQSMARIDLAKVKGYFPDAASWGDAESHAGRQVLSSQGKVLGYVIETSPDSDRFLGFSGPTNLLIAFDLDDRIVGLHVIESRDTRSHVDLIVKHPTFFSSWRGQTWSEAASRVEVDGVAGATLTSLAMIQGLQQRLGAKDIPQKFLPALELKDAIPFYPQATRIEQDPAIKALWHVRDRSARVCGAILRTSPAADNVIGYQGPTETRLAIAPDGSIQGLAIAASFDNEPYVGYVRGDPYFAKLLKKYSISQWSGLDLDQAEIEGVSGATMTSLAVANGIIEAAKRYDSDIRSQREKRARLVDSLWRGVGTLVIIGLGLLIGLTSLRGRTAIRVPFQIVVIVYLGWINADLLSLAMFGGWAQAGIPWTNAIGLVALTAAAVVLPIAARTNLYCSHLCPHGAVQQLLPRRWKQVAPMPRWLLRLLQGLRPMLLVWVVLVCMLHWPFNLVDIEPFDAYAWRAAAWPTLLVAVVGIIASLRVPMAYCRFGCGTGAILQYLRRNAQSDRLTASDLFAFVCFASAVVLYALE